MGQQVTAARVDRARLRRQIKAKYTEVALEPEKGFHFHRKPKSMQQRRRKKR